MRPLLALLNGDESVTLDVAALEVAEVEFPRLDSAPYLATLDAWAAEIARRLGRSSGGFAYVQTANRYLFEELGFLGNEADFYNPHNSCLNKVIDSRTGIPITLSVIYMEIARRLGRPVTGIGLPGRFLVEYQSHDFTTYLDPFRGGRPLTAEECFEVSRQSSGTAVRHDPELLRPLARRDIVVRMLHNLRSIYFHRKAHRKYVRVLDLLIEAAPDSADLFKLRSAGHAHLRRYRQSLRDLETYLKLAPEADDRKEMEEQISYLRHLAAGMN